MADEYPGTMVKVTMQRPGGGEPVRLTYAVAEPDAQKAVEIVRHGTSAATEDIVQPLGRLPQSALKEYGLAPGQFVQT